MQKEGENMSELQSEEQKWGIIDRIKNYPLYQLEVETLQKIELTIVAQLRNQLYDRMVKQGDYCFKMGNRMGDTLCPSLLMNVIYNPSFSFNPVTEWNGWVEVVCPECDGKQIVHFDNHMSKDCTLHGKECVLDGWHGCWLRIDKQFVRALQRHEKIRGYEDNLMFGVTTNLLKQLYPEEMKEFEKGMV